MYIQQYIHSHNKAINQRIKMQFVILMRLVIEIFSLNSLHQGENDILSVNSNE